MPTDPVTESTLADRSRAILASARRWKHEGERLALLADELNHAPDTEYAPYSVETWVDVGARARAIASDVREQDAYPGQVLEAARELVALVDFLAERAAAEEADDRDPEPPSRHGGERDALDRWVDAAPLGGEEA